MERVIGVGGIFFKANDPEKLGRVVSPTSRIGGGRLGRSQFPGRRGRGAQTPRRQSHLVWSPFAADTSYFAPSEKSYMMNFRVHDLAAFVAQLRAAGVAVEEKTEESEFGKFGWLMDPEGTRIELWEPPPAKEEEPGQ